MFDFSNVFSSFKGGKLNGFDAMILTNSFQKKEEDDDKEEDEKEDKDRT